MIDLDALQQTATPNFPAGATIGDVVNALIPYIFSAGGLMLLLYLLYGGFMFMFSGGDPGKAAQAKGIITNALLGFVIVFSAYWIIQVLALLLDLPYIQSIF